MTLHFYSLISLASPASISLQTKSQPSRFSLKQDFPIRKKVWSKLLFLPMLIPFEIVTMLSQSGQDRGETSQLVGRIEWLLPSSNNKGTFK